MDCPKDDRQAVRYAASCEASTARMPIVVLFLLLLGGVAAAQQQYEPSHPLIGNSNWLTPYVPTPMRVAEKMLELAEVKSSDVVYDLGSGDGRIVILAAQKFGARAVGVELDARLARESSARIAALGLERRASIIRADMFATDLRPATVVTIYQLGVVNQRLRPQLERQLRVGTRVITLDFPMRGWQPVKVTHLESENGVANTLYQYVCPQSGRGVAGPG
jgi:protein-L-isoaspartate O-methyltransferase